MKHREGGRVGAVQGLGREVAARVSAYLEELGVRPVREEFPARIERFATLLGLWGRRTNLTAVPDQPEAIAFHLMDSLAPLIVADLMAPDAMCDAFGKAKRVLDLGSGAGFPGLILAAASDADFVLLEARRKRASFLRLAAAEMGLANVWISGTLDTGRESRTAFDTVTARAFAKPATVYRTAADALVVGGHLILYLNPEQPRDTAEAVVSGFRDHRELPYTLRREDKPVRRCLAVWRRAD